MLTDEQKERIALMTEHIKSPEKAQAEYDARVAQAGTKLHIDDAADDGTLREDWMNNDGE